MDEVLSPSFKHDKLANPTDADLIDVLEDIWRGYIFAPVGQLLAQPYGEVAAMTLLCSYFEALWTYVTGESSDKQSQHFFVKGFCRVFRSETPESESAAKAIYKHVRCGLSHTGMLSSRVHYSRSGQKAFILTFPYKADRTLDFSAPVKSIVVNPERMFVAVREHFDSYVKTLREANGSDAIMAFSRAAHSLWGIGEQDNIIAMTEDEFLGRA
jgi:hypothetical protein